MKVQEIILENNKKGYILLDVNGFPVLPVLRYLKYLDTTGKKSNTIKTYCYALKQYFQFLYESNYECTQINLERLAEFVGWLRSPYKSVNVLPLKTKMGIKTEKTINLTISVVTNFYDYLYRNEEIPFDLVERIMKKKFNGQIKFKGFLYHLNKGSSINRNIFKIKEPRKKLKVLTKEQIGALINSTTNVRDKFLLQLLFETGLRIGEVLSLYIEDFILSHKDGHRIRLVDRGELENGARLKTGEREIFVSQALMDLYDDYLYDVLEEVDLSSNFLFIKIRGKNIGKAMNYQDVSSLFKRLRNKTGIDVHPHLFRHTHATMYYRQTKNIKQVQERLGHSHIQTTMNLYVHPSDEEIREEWEKSQHAFKLVAPLKPEVLNERT
ncbi:tyrosine-type recombinase/integrase [Bacillus paramycoides]|uniref:tyrosine-type recombinase/integrase n=1 Tax=Bacillus paramycoides TaxID=2026194 RepID=UPI003D1BE53D